MATYAGRIRDCKGKNQQENDFICSICLNRYENPRSLPCSHSFCHKCLIQCLEKNKSNQRFYCPFCRTEAKVYKRLNAEEMVEQFPMDFDLIQKMSTVTDKSSDEESTSNYCKPCLRDKMYEQASVYCCECSEILCSDCKKHHSKNKLTTTHTVVDMNGDLGETRKLNYVKNLTKCSNHQLEEVKYICKDHDQLCCNECAILTHRKCKTLQSISDCVASGFENRLLENMETMEKHVVNMKLHEEKHRKRVCESETLIKDQLLCIKEEFDYAFRDFEENVLMQVRSNCIGLKNSISSQQMLIDSFERDIKRSKEKISSVQQYGQDLHVFLMKRAMEKEMKQKEQILQSLHESSNRLEVSLAGKETISQKLITTLKQNLSIKKIVQSELPDFPFKRCNGSKFQTSAGFRGHGNIKKDYWGGYNDF